jgi:hypothetical protein
MLAWELLLSLPSSPPSEFTMSTLYICILTCNTYLDNYRFFMRLNSLFAACAGAQDVHAAISCHSWQRSNKKTSCMCQSEPFMLPNFYKLPVIKQCIKYP